MHKALSPEIVEQFKQYIRMCGAGTDNEYPAGDRLQFYTMPDAAFKAVLGNIRIRERKPGDGGGVLNCQPEMKEIIRINLEDHCVTAAWHIDKRIALEPGLPLDRILTMPPQQWNFPQLRSIAGPLPSVAVPLG